MSSVDFHRTYITDESFIRGAARLLWASVSTAFPATIGAVINLSTYDPMSGWNDLGATKTGIQITVNNAEETFDVDQILGDIMTQPTNWEVTVGTNLAESTVERMQVAWEGGTIATATEDGVSTKTMGVGQPQFYTPRRLAVLFKRNNGKVRGYFFRKVQHMPQESNVSYNKTGEQQQIPVRFKAIADTSIADVYSRFFVIKDQQ
jgi:hypothetical protein